MDFDTPVDLSDYARRLSEAGYVRVDMVDGMGQFAIRGGILDVFPPVFEAIGEDVDNVKPTPFRIELFGDEIDRVGPFDIESQRFLQNLDGLMFPPAHETLADRDILLSVRDAVLTQQKRAKDASAARELEKELTAIDLCLHNDDYDLSFIDKYISLVYPERECLLDYFGERPFVILRSHAAVGERLKVFEQTLAQTVTDLLTSGTISPKLAEYACPIGKFHTFCSSSVAVRLDSLMASASGERLGGLFTFRTKHHVSYNEKYDLLYEDITNSIRSGYKTIVIAENETSAKNLGGLLKEKGYKTSVEGDGKDYTAEDLPVGTVYITWRAFLSGYELASSRISIFSLCPTARAMPPRSRGGLRPPSAKRAAPRLFSPPPTLRKATTWCMKTTVSVSMKAFRS